MVLTQVCGFVSVRELPSHDVGQGRGRQQHLADQVGVGPGPVEPGDDQAGESNLQISSLCRNFI